MYRMHVTPTKTYGRTCMKCGTFQQQIIKTFVNGNILIRCKCGETAEITQTGHSIPATASRKPRESEMFRMDPPEPREADESDAYRPTDAEIDALIATGGDPRFIMDAVDLPY